MGKKYNEAIKLIDRTQQYAIADACDLVVKTATAKFDETIEAAVRLGVNPRHAEQMIRSSVSLPHGTGKTTRVAVFARGERATQAKEAGADVVGAEDLVERIQKENWLEFDSAIATPDMMGLVGRLGRILGPRNLMPNPKVGTVTMDVVKAVTELKAGRIEFRTEKTGIVHAPIGKASFGPDKLKENLSMLITTLHRLKPATAKGKYVKSVAIAATMGPGVRIDLAEVMGLDAR